MRQSSHSTADDGESESPFERFRRVMRGLMAVPKSELDEKIAASTRANQQKRRRRAARG
jgi:hypothetical protein